MKKIILIVAILALGNSYGQTITIINNTLNTITVEYREMDCSGNTITNNVTIGPFSTIGPTSITTGYTHFAGATSYETSTITPQNTYIATGMLPNAFFPNCSVSPNASSACLYTQNCTVTWADFPITIPTPNGLADVTIEFN